VFLHVPSRLIFAGIFPAVVFSELPMVLIFASVSPMPPPLASRHPSLRLALVFLSA